MKRQRIIATIALLCATPAIASCGSASFAEGIDCDQALQTLNFLEEMRPYNESTWSEYYAELDRALTALVDGGIVLLENSAAFDEFDDERKVLRSVYDAEMKGIGRTDEAQFVESLQAFAQDTKPSLFAKRSLQLMADIAVACPEE